MKYLCLAGGVSPRGCWFTTWGERSDWTRYSGVKIFRAREEVKTVNPAEGVSPRGYWYTVWRERSDWTRTSEAKIFRAREEVKTVNPAEGVSPRARRERPSAHEGWSGYWFEPE